MKEIVFSAIALALLTGTAFAGKGGEKMFTKMDADNDSKVTPAEHAEFWKQWFKRKDTNGDGALEWKEWAATNFDRIDKNKDQKIDADEHKAFFARQFKSLDANKDGHITLEEFTKK